MEEIFAVALFVVVLAAIAAELLNRTVAALHIECGHKSEVEG